MFGHVNKQDSKVAWIDHIWWTFWAQKVQLKNPPMILLPSQVHRVPLDIVYSKFLQFPFYKFLEWKRQHKSCQGSSHIVPHNQICIVPKLKSQESHLATQDSLASICVWFSQKTYGVEPVTVPNPFTVERNNKAPFGNVGLRMFGKQWEPTSIIPEINISISIKWKVKTLKLCINGYLRRKYPYILTPVFIAFTRKIHLITNQII